MEEPAVEQRGDADHDAFLALQGNQARVSGMFAALDELFHHVDLAGMTASLETVADLGTVSGTEHLLHNIKRPIPFLILQHGDIRAKPFFRMGGMNAFSNEAAREIEEGVQAVVVDPMAGAVHRNDLRGPEMPDAAVFLRIGGPAFLAVDQHRGA